MPIAIAGMHRSGSSLITRLLNLCGLDLGPADQLMPPAPDNPEGFWENLQFVHVNECMIGQLGGRWDLPPQPLPGWEELSLLDPWREMARGLPTELSLKPPWGWKDPRNLLTMPFWRSLWPELKTVVCVRNPLEVANSLLERDGISLRGSLKLWREHYGRFLSSGPNDGLIVTHFDSYFVDPNAELARLVGLLQLPADEARIRSATNAVIGGLRHSCLGLDDLARAGVPADVQSLYSRLCADGGPVMARALAEGSPARKDYVNAVRLALEFEARCEEQEVRIRDLEPRLRYCEVDREWLRQLFYEYRTQANEMSKRLSARRHRYAEQVAEALLKVAKPLHLTNGR